MPTINTRYKNKGLHEYSVRHGLSLSIGRLPDNDIVIDNDAVSGKHARIVSNGDEYYVEDLNSTNGTFVNNKRIRSRKLKDEDIIVIGKHDLIFEMTEDGYGEGIGSPEFSNGLQTLHGLYPLFKASFAELKNSTFSTFGFLAVHIGLQNIPVVFTAVIKSPS